MLALTAAGCAAGAGLRPEAERMSPIVTAPGGQAGLRDLRAGFRTALCTQLAEAPGRTCDQVITRMGGEPLADERPFPTPSVIASRYRIGIVPGFLAECLDDEARPFAAEEKALRARGFEVVYLKTTGRGRVDVNAWVVSQQIAALPPDPRPFLTDAVAVPGALVGSVNADHWAVAMQLWLAFPVLAGSFIDDVPRGAMLDAVIAVVARDLEGR